MITFKQFLNEKTDSNAPGWYIVNDETDAIASGPYDSKAQADRDAKFLQWYNPEEFFIEHGVIDLDHEGGFDRFKEVPV